jgi:anti-anti-sigma factor
MRILRLMGRLDVAGEAEIETKFAAYCALEGGRVLVDIGGVEFISSIGLGMLILNAKALAGRGGKIALLNPAPNVRSVLELSGNPSITPCTMVSSLQRLSCTPADCSDSSLSSPPGTLRATGILPSPPEHRYAMPIHKN